MINKLFLYKYWDLFPKWEWWKLSFSLKSQPISDANDEISQWKNMVRGVWLDGRWLVIVRTGKLRHSRRENWKAAFSFNWSRKDLWMSFRLTISSQNKTQRDLKLLHTKKFGFSNEVHVVNWPRYKNSGADVLSVYPSLRQSELGNYGSLAVFILNETKNEIYINCQVLSDDYIYKEK